MCFGQEVIQIEWPFLCSLTKTATTTKIIKITKKIHLTPKRHILLFSDGWGWGWQLVMMLRSFLVWGYLTGPDTMLCPNYPGVNLAQELWHLQCLSGNESNTLTDAVVKCMKLDCVVPPFPLSQSTSLPMPELLTRASCRKDWERSLLNHPSRPPDDPISQGNDLNWTELNFKLWVGAGQGWKPLCDWWGRI